MQANFVRSSLFVAVGLLATACVAQEENTAKATSEGGDPFKPTVTREQVEAWRKKYGFESLAERLEYERPVREQPALRLGDEAEAQLNQADQWGQHSSARANSLEMLHTMEVDEFVQRSGFGFSRRPQPGARELESRAADPIDLVKLPPLSDEESGRAPTAYLRGDHDAPGSAATVLRWMPTREEIGRFHVASKATFANIWNFGFIQSVDRVAGFQSHHFAMLPQTPVDPAPLEQKRWSVTRLELVSLLKHETPRVYVSDHLPRMEELSSATAETRALTAFETASLAKLHDGEEVLTASAPNRIEMLGAVRASKQCMQCHEVPHGTMLGAFSYELRRDPPIKIVLPSETVQ